MAKKVDWKKAKRKEEESIKASNTFLERINNDLDYIKAKREIQSKYNLPLPPNIPNKTRAWSTWLGLGRLERQPDRITKRREDFYRDIDALFARFEILEAYHNQIIAEIAGTSLGQHIPVWGHYGSEIHADENGEMKWRAIITPKTDLTNPLILSMLQDEQKLYAGDPPKPKKDKSNSRKLDWRPVYEWYKMHPLFTIAEIAKKTGYKPHYVRLKFSEIESSN